MRRLESQDIDQAELSSYIPAELDRIHDAMLEKAKPLCCDSGSPTLICKRGHEVQG